MNKTHSTLPIIDISDEGDAQRRLDIASQINQACRNNGFFYVVGHGVSSTLTNRLHRLSTQFFALPPEQKVEISMSRGGRAWRGYFKVGDELTSGKPDLKEGIYFGQELAGSHPLVVAQTPLHGPNLFPVEPEGLSQVVLEYMECLTKLGHRLMSLIALALGLSENYFVDNGVQEPLTLFRIFNYPSSQSTDLWGVGEHTDYGLLTILLQDEIGGLEVKTNEGWIDAPPINGAFICNIGDMLDRMTRGVYRSTPHRVRNSSSKSRLSFPFFFDPNFHAQIQPIELPNGERASDDQQQRWDKTSVHTFSGTYGDYLLNKIGKVFPGLRSEVL